MVWLQLSPRVPEIRPVPATLDDIGFTPGKAHDTRTADHFEVDRRMAFVKRTETIDDKVLGQHPADREADEAAQFRAGIEAAQDGERSLVHGGCLVEHRFAFRGEHVAFGATVEQGASE